MEKEYRVKKSQEIENILANKNKVGSKNFTIYQKNNETNHYRLAISVSKKCGNAVIRNRHKRRIREIIRHQSLLDCDIFIIAKISSTELTFSEMEKEILYLLRKGNLIKKQ